MWRFCDKDRKEFRENERRQKREMKENQSNCEKKGQRLERGDNGRGGTFKRTLDGLSDDKKIRSRKNRVFERERNTKIKLRNKQFKTVTVSRGLTPVLLYIV